MSDLTNIDAALRYAELGCPVIPVQPQSKIPLIKDWTHQASRDSQRIRQWWQSCPNASIGIVTGQISNLVVLDVDVKSDGEQSLERLVNLYGQLPPTWEVRTGGGGRHLYFKESGTGVRNSAGKLGPGLDIRGEGGYVVAPPSKHPNGNSYSWINEPEFGRGGLPPIPGWLATLLLSEDNLIRRQMSGTAATGGLIQQGQRNSTLTSLAGNMRRMGMTQSEIFAALLILNQQRGYPPLPSQEVEDIARSISRYSSTTGTPTDDELAQVWLDKNPNTCFGLGDFRRFQNGIWTPVSDRQAEKEVLGILEGAKSIGVKPSSNRLHSILELARIKSNVQDAKWDKHPELIPCLNGTLDTNAKVLRDHSPEDYMTSGIPCEYDRKANQDVWTNYLATTVPEAAEFLQEFAGYCLTTDTRHEVAVWLYGPAGCGKSTFITGIQAMLGERAGLLGLADIERSRFALGGLPGKTLMVSAEQPAAFMTTSYILNGLISGEPITIERKYHDSVVFIPRAKLLWAMNELPRVPDAGNGLFRRVKVVQFPQLSVNPNPEIKEEIKRMGTGILAWAVEGLYRLQSRGHFEIPECVKAATDGFQESNDIPRAFVDECCIRGDTFETQSSTLYSAYEDWCRRSGHKPQSSTTLARDWGRLGFMRRRTANGVLWQGVRLNNVQTM